MHPQYPEPDEFTQQALAALLQRWRTTRQIFRPRFPCGATNAITDVTGVTVGHSTLAAGDVQTGVTAVVPPGDNLYQQPLPCGVAVLNGFAKPMGLIQVMELGELQTPILLSNTFATGVLFNAMIKRSCQQFPQMGRPDATINPLILECNDFWLNDIQAMAVSEDDALTALDGATSTFTRGSVGAGRGMSSFGLKGGPRVVLGQDLIRRLSSTWRTQFDRNHSRLAAGHGVRVHTIALGPEDLEHQPASRDAVDAVALREIAEAGGGTSFRVRGMADLEAMAAALDELEPNPMKRPPLRYWRPLWMWPGGAALALVVLLAAWRRR